jgi:hypothetical protein
VMFDDLKWLLVTREHCTYFRACHRLPMLDTDRSLTMYHDCKDAKSTVHCLAAVQDTSFLLLQACKQHYRSHYPTTTSKESRHTKTLSPSTSSDPQTTRAAKTSSKKTQWRITISNAPTRVAAGSDAPAPLPPSPVFGKALRKSIDRGTHDGFTRSQLFRQPKNLCHRRERRERVSPAHRKQEQYETPVPRRF